MNKEHLLKIGQQEIDLLALAQMAPEALIPILEQIYFDGYQAGKAAAPQAPKTTEEVVIKKESSEEIRISLATIQDETVSTEDPLHKRMREMEEMVYRFKRPGFVLYRLNGTEEEYLMGKYNYSSLPMKALVFDSLEEAKAHKDAYWGAYYEELKIRQV